MKHRTASHPIFGIHASFYRSIVLAVILFVNPFVEAETATTWPAFPGTRLTLHLSDVSLEEALHALTDRSGTPSVAPLSETQAVAGIKITLDAKDAPWWSVLLDISKQAGMPIQFDDNEGVVRLAEVRGKPTALPNYCEGGVLLLCESAASRGMIYYGTPSKTLRMTSVNLQLFTEPQAKVFAIDEAVEQVVAHDNSGKVIDGLPKRGTRQARPRSFNYSVTGNQLDVPPIADLAMSIGLWTVESQDTIDVKDVLNAQGTHKTPGGRSFEIGQAKFDGRGEWSVSVGLKTEGLPEAVVKNLRGALNDYQLHLVESGSDKISYSVSIDPPSESVLANIRIETTQSDPRPTLPIQWRFPTKVNRQLVPIKIERMP